MPDVVTQVNPFMGYEHRDKDGNLISKGTSHLRRGNKVQFIQVDAKGNKLAENTQDMATGNILEHIVYDEKGKVTEKFNFEYNDKNEVIKVTDNTGVISVLPEFAEKELI